MNAKQLVKRYMAGRLGRWLDLRGCDLKGISLPTSMSGSLVVSDCDLRGITLPTNIGDSLYLRGCDLKGITLPASLRGSLDLSGCDLEGIALPTWIGGSLDLKGCDLKGLTLAGLEALYGRRGRAVSVRDDDILWIGDDGMYTAKYHGPLTLAQAIAHWREDERERGRQFTTSLKKQALKNPTSLFNRVLPHLLIGLLICMLIWVLI